MTVAFLNFKLKEIDGMVLGRYLKDLNPGVNLIYLTGNVEGAYDALRQHASG